MSRRAKRSGRRSPKPDPVHAQIVKQANAMWALYGKTGTPAATAMFPAIAELYFAAEHAYVNGRIPSRRAGFLWHGKRYPIEITNLGRLRILDADSGRLIVNGGIGAVW